MKKIYDLFLDEEKMGTTALENADVTMGVVSGQIKFTGILSGYTFFKQYCLQNNIDFTDHPEDRLIMTGSIPRLKVMNPESIEIAGTGISVSGMDSDVFDITIPGIPYPFYEAAFPHHVRAYKDRFANENNC